MIPITPVEIAPGSTGSYQDVDLSAYVDAGNTAGVVIEVFEEANASSNTAWGARKNGSTDTQGATNIDREHTFVAIGIDSNDIIELYRAGTTVKFFLVGYFTDSEAEFFTNAEDVSPGSTGWQDVDISGYTSSTALFACLQFQNTNESVQYIWGARKNGSTDSWYGSVNTGGLWGAFIGVDANEVLEVNRGNTTYINIYLTGYIYANVTSFTNAINYSTGSVGSFQDVDLSSDVPAGNDGAFILFEEDYTNYMYAIRKNGASYDRYQDASDMAFTWVELDGDRKCEQKIESTDLGTYLLGYTWQSAGVEVEPAAAAALAATVNPTTVKGSLSLSPTVGAALGASVNPTVVKGSLAIVPSAAAAEAAAVDPTVEAGDITITPTAAAALAATNGPTVALGSTTASPSPAAALGDSAAPTVVKGSLAIAPSAAAALAASADPAVIANVTIAPAAAAALVASSGPAVHYSSTIASPGTSFAIAATQDPAVLFGSVTLAPDAAAAVAATADPAAVIGAVTVTPAAAEILAATAGPVVYTGVSVTLLEAQRSETIDALIKLVLTHGETTCTYTRDRILACDHEEQPYTQTAAVVLDNSDGELTDLDLKGFQGVISYGAVTSLGDEYQATAPLWVTGQELDSSQGELSCTLQLHGVPDRLSLDKASAVYAPLDTDTKTVKDLIGEILGATISCYNHCQAYDIEWDSEDSLIDAYQPKDSFRIYLNSSRMAVLRKLLDYTKCAMRLQDDGKVHIFQPQVSGEAYDYEYSLSRGEHAFFSKAYRNRLVMPNYIHVQTPTYAAVQYSGIAQDAESVAAIGEIRYYVRTYLISNAQGQGIAEAVLSKYQLQASTGKATVPLNPLARVFDYVRVTDARQEDERAGSVGFLARHYKAGRKGSTWEMDFGFGNWLSMQRLLNNLELASDLSYDFLRLSVKNLNAEKITAGDIDVDTLSAICAYLGDVSIAGGDVTLGSAGISLFGERFHIYDGATKAGSIYEANYMVRLAGWNGYGVRLITEVGEGADIVLQADGDVDIGANGIVDITDAAETDDLDASTTDKCIGKTTKYDEIHANDLYGTTHCYDEHDDLALIKQLRPCDDNPSLIATPSLPEFLRPSRDYALAKKLRDLQEKEGRQKERIFERIQEEKDPQKQARLQLKLEAVGSDRQARLDAFAQHFDAELAQEASVSKTVFFAIGAIKQVAHQLDTINARLTALEESR